MKARKVTPISSKYFDLIKRFPLRPIKTELENRAALDVLNDLLDRSNANELDDGEQDYYEVLAFLVERYDGKCVLGARPRPGEMLDFLMEQHGLIQADLVDELGSQTTVSLILHGKRLPTTAQIDALARRFHVSPAVFFGGSALEGQSRVAEATKSYASTKQLKAARVSEPKVRYGSGRRRSGGT